VAAALGTIYDGERKLAARLLSAVVPGMLVLADRGFFSFELEAQYLVTGADLLWRVTAGIKFPVTELLPDGSYLSVINSKKTRSAGYRILSRAKTRIDCGRRIGHPCHVTWAYSWISPADPIAVSGEGRAVMRAGGVV
jgi:hypothetical protein